MEANSSGPAERSALFPRFFDQRRGRANAHNFQNSARFCVSLKSIDRSLGAVNVTVRCAKSTGPAGGFSIRRAAPRAYPRQKLTQAKSPWHCLRAFIYVCNRSCDCARGRSSQARSKQGIHDYVRRTNFRPDAVPVVLLTMISRLLPPSTHCERLAPASPRTSSGLPKRSTRVGSLASFR